MSENNEPHIVRRQITWYCDVCIEPNHTDRKEAAPICRKCGTVHTWLSIAGNDAYETTIDSDGRVDHDAYVPDLPDDDDYTPGDTPDMHTDE